MDFIFVQIVAGTDIFDKGRNVCIAVCDVALCNPPEAVSVLYRNTSDIFGILPLSGRYGMSNSEYQPGQKQKQHCQDDSLRGHFLYVCRFGTKQLPEKEAEAEEAPPAIPPDMGTASEKTASYVR